MANLNSLNILYFSRIDVNILLKERAGYPSVANPNHETVWNKQMSFRLLPVIYSIYFSSVLFRKASTPGKTAIEKTMIAAKIPDISSIKQFVRLFKVL